jgi:hypothetical protein
MVCFRSGIRLNGGATYIRAELLYDSGLVERAGPRRLGGTTKEDGVTYQTDLVTTMRKLKYLVGDSGNVGRLLYTSCPTARPGSGSLGDSGSGTCVSPIPPLRASTRSSLVLNRATEELVMLMELSMVEQRYDAVRGARRSDGHRCLE